MKKVVISVGDLNGVGIEIALKAHEEVKKLCNPVYSINKHMLTQASELLNIPIPNDFNINFVDGDFHIKPGEVSGKAGYYSYDSFMNGVKLCQDKYCDALVTLPIHKEAWEMGGVEFKGHTDVLRKYFKQDAIMMLGCEKMFVALYTEHIPLKDVAKEINRDKLILFFINLLESIGMQKIGVLGLNPHAGDNGVLGNEEDEIISAIEFINLKLGKKLLYGPLVPDVAFTSQSRKNYKYYVAMYHDQGLIPLKTLYFQESINVSLNLPIIRTSVDHGTAFDIAYKGKASTLSYINAIKSAISL